MKQARRFLLGFLFLWAGLAAPALAYPITYTLNTTTNATTCTAARLAQPEPNDGCYGSSNNLCLSFGLSSCYTWPGETAAAFIVVASCPTGTVALNSVCVTACEYDAGIPASDPLCVAPPPPSTCTAGPAGELSVKNDLGVTATTFCDGSCEFSLSWNNDTTYCWSYDEEPGQFCNYDKSLSGASCSAAVDPVADPFLNLPPEQTPVAAPAVVCPTGTTANAFGGCSTPVVPGTVATNTSPATAPTGGLATSCPGGYVLNTDGYCESYNDNQTGCPNGYTLSNLGKCQATATLSSQSSSLSGAPGTSDAGSAAKAAAETAAVGTQGDGLIASVAAAPAHGWSLNFFNLLPQNATCTPWVIAAGGRSMTIDPCPTIDKIKALAGFLFYVLTAFSLFHILFRPEATA